MTSVAAVPQCAGHRRRRWQYLELLRELRAHRLVLRGDPPGRARRCAVHRLEAGSNIACPTIMRRHDMPICDPGGFDALALVPFQINPHYCTATRRIQARRARNASAQSVSASDSWVRACVKAPGSSSRTDRCGCWATRSAASSATQEPRELTSADDFSFLLE